MAQNLTDLINFELSRNPEYLEKLKKAKEERVNSFGSAVERAAVGTKKALFDGFDAVGTAIETKSGKETDFTNYLQKIGKKNSSKAQAQLESLGTPTINTEFLEIKNVGDAAEFGKTAVGTMAGSVGTQLSMAAPIKFVGKLFFGASVPGRILSTAFAALPFIGTSIGEIYKSAVNKGASPEEAAEKSILGGIANGLIDSNFGALLYRKIFSPVDAAQKISELSKTKLSKAIGKDVVKVGATGAATEAAVAANTEIISNQIAGIPTDTKELSRRVINDAAVGAVGGAAISPVTGTMSKLETDALIENKKESDEFIQIAEKIKEEDIANLGTIRRTTSSIERLEQRIKLLDKKADEANKKVGSVDFIEQTGVKLVDLKTKRKTLLDEYKQARQNALVNEAKQKRIEIKNIDEEINNVRKQTQQDTTYSTRAGKVRARLQDEINKQRDILNLAKSKGQNKGELLVSPEMLGGGKPNFISNLYQGSILQKLFGRATSPLRQRAIQNYREKGDTQVFRIYNYFETFYPEAQALTGKYLSPIIEAVRTLQPPARTGVRDISSALSLGFIKESPTIALKNQELLMVSLQNNKGYIFTKLGNTKLAKKIDEADTVIRKVLREVYGDARDVGIDVNYLPNYVPARYLLESKKNQEKFKEIARKYIKDDNQIEGIVESINDEGGYYLTKMKGKIKKDIPDRTANVNLEKRRKLPQEMINELQSEGLVDTNILEILPSYLSRAAKDIQFEKSFKNIETNARDLMSKGLLNDKEFNTIGNTLQAIQGKYGTQVPKGFAKGAYNFALSTAYFYTLPFAALTALSEPLILLGSLRPGAALVSALKLPVNAFLRTARLFFPRIKKSNTEKAFQEIMYGLDGSLTERMVSSSAIELPRRSTNAFFKATMLTQVTQLSRQMAFNGFKSELKKDTSSIVNGNLKGTVKGLELQRKYQQVGIPDIFKLVDDITGKPFEDTFRENNIIKAAATRFVDKIIMTPNPTNRPLWMSSPVLAATSQLKSFAFVFGNTVGFQLLKKLIGTNVRPTERANALLKNGVAMSMIILVSMYTDLLKEMFRSSGTDDEIKDLKALIKKRTDNGQNYVFDVIAGTNIAGGGTAFKHALDAARYGQSPLVSLLLGPIGSKADALFKGVSNVLKDDPNAKPLVREVLTINPILSANKDARDAAIKMILGEDDDFKSYEEFIKDMDLNI